MVSSRRGQRRAARGASADEAPAGCRWLLLLHQLPTRPSRARVKTWRRLQQIGAVPVRNSAYALPNSPQAREDLEWLKAEIVAMGGQAAVFAADPAETSMHAELVDAFRAAREEEYRALSDEIAAVERRMLSGAARGGRVAPATALRTVRALRGRLAGVVGIDFFQSPARRGAERDLVALERRLLVNTPRAPRHGEPRLDAAAYRGRTWVTRPNPGVDRMASAWLIRTFIDPKARFRFAEKPSGRHVAFDMYHGEFSHRGGLCTFEVLVDRFGIVDAAVRRIGEIVHDLDLKDRRFDSPEAATVGALVEGFRGSQTGDEAALQHGVELFQALYRSMTAATRPAASARSVAKRNKKRRTR